MGLIQLNPMELDLSKKYHVLTTPALLKFSKSNGKLSNRLIFSIPAGYTCPHAGKCHTFADRTTGKLTDNPHGCSESLEYRCFAAMAEARFPAVRDARWHNFDQLKAVRNI